MPLHFHLANAKIKLNYDLDIMIKHLLFDFASLSIPAQTDPCMNNLTRSVEKCSYSAFLFFSVTFELLLLIYLKTRVFLCFFMDFSPVDTWLQILWIFFSLSLSHSQRGGIFFLFSQLWLAVSIFKCPVSLKIYDSLTTILIFWTMFNRRTRTIQQIWISQF